MILTEEQKLDFILRKFHGITREQWEERKDEWPWIELPYLVDMVWNAAQNPERE